jgi:hypothetical protein
MHATAVQVIDLVHQSLDIRRQAVHQQNGAGEAGAVGFGRGGHPFQAVRAQARQRDLAADRQGQGDDAAVAPGAGLNQAGKDAAAHVQAVPVASRQQRGQVLAVTIGDAQQPAPFGAGRGRQFGCGLFSA